MSKETSPHAYRAFDWHHEIESILDSIRRQFDSRLWQSFYFPLFKSDPSRFFATLPLPIRNQITESIQLNLTSYIWELLKTKDGLYPFSYYISPSGDLIPKQDKHHLDVLAQYANSPLFRLDETPNILSLDRRSRRQFDELVGLAHAREHILHMDTNQLVFWVSPPGEKSDGYLDFTLIYFAQKLADQKTINCFSLAVNTRLLNLIDLLNHYLPHTNKLPSHTNPSQLLHQSILTSSKIATIISTLETILSQDQEKPIHLSKNIFQQAQIISQYQQFISLQIQSLLSGASAEALSLQLVQFNRSHKVQIIANIGGSATSCGEIDFGKDDSPTHDKPTKETFICPACNRPTDPCLGTCHHCGATPYNYRQTREQLTKPKTSSRPPRTIYSKPKPILPSYQSLTTSPTYYDDPNFKLKIQNLKFPPDEYIFVISGLSVLKLHHSLASKFGLLPQN